MASARVHPLWRHRVASSGDLAVLHLASPLVLDGRRVAAIALPPELPVPAAEPLAIGPGLTVSGYGLTSGGGTTAGDGSTGTAAPGSTGNATGNAATPGMSVADTVKAVSGLITSLAGLIVAMTGFLALLRQRRSTSPATPSDTPPANDGQPRLWRPGDDL